MTAYHHKSGKHDPRLTEVGRGSAMGELLRRYWMPVGKSDYATALPRMIRALGEDLILFRGGNGAVGLVHPRCIHRGSSLLFGRVEDDGIRCCYHGWKFGVDGTCIDQPCEPNGGVRSEVYRQPWYPVQERYGLIWSFMGPPEKQPLLPKYNVLEELDPGEQLFADDSNIGAVSHLEIIPYNWLQHYENIHDPGHVFWLHFLHSGPQFGARFGELELAKLQEQLPGIVAAAKPYVTPNGVAEVIPGVLPDGRSLRNVIESVMPTVRAVPSPRGKPGRIDHLGFVLPVDDTHYRIFTVYRGTDRTFLDEAEARNAEWALMTQEDRQRFPSDFEAQGSLGPITLHSDEHLTRSDAGIIAVRRFFEAQVKNVEQGREPAGVCFEAGAERVMIDAGSFIDEV